MLRLTGIFSVGIYFADLVSDLQVAFLLVNTGNFVWATLSILLLVLQFFVVHMRVLPYLSSTFGKDSPFYIAFVFLSQLRRVPFDLEGGIPD